MSGAKADINTFYSKAKRPPPQYNYFPQTNPEDSNLPYFGCSLSISGTHDDNDGFDHRTFVGKAQNKKKAADHAAEDALAYIKNFGIYQRIMLEENQGWWPRLEKMLTEVQGWKKNPFCRKYVIECVKFNEGKIPLAGLICQQPLLRDLSRKYGDKGIPSLLRKLVQDLQAYLTERSLDCKLQFDEKTLIFTLSDSCIEQLKKQYYHQFQRRSSQDGSEGHWVEYVGDQENKRLQVEAEQVIEQQESQQLSEKKVLGDQQITVEQNQTSQLIDETIQSQELPSQLSEDQKQQQQQIEEFVAVYVPADVRKPPFEVKFKKQGFFMQRLAECLDCEANNLLGWGKHSPQSVKVLNQDNGSASWGQQQGQKPEDESISPDIYYDEIKEPSVYSVYVERSSSYGSDENKQQKQVERKINPRVMWLMNGNPGVFGDVLLSTTRVTLTDEGYVYLCWRNFTVDQFWMNVNAGFPVYSYLTGLRVSTIGNFPIGYWSKVHWSGHDPQGLLCGYAERKGLKAPLFKSEDNQEDDPDTPLYTCKVTAHAFMRGEEDPVRTEARALGDLDIAIQTASLRALYKIQNLDMQTLGFDVGEFNEADLAPDIVDVPTDLGEVSLEDDAEMGEEQEQQAPVDTAKGSELFRTIAKLNYSVSVLDSSGKNMITVESHPHFNVYLQCGLVKKEIEDKILEVGKDGKFKLDVDVPIAGPDICKQLKSVPGFLKAQVVDVKQISVLIGRKGAGSGQLFATPLSAQRYRFVADVMKENKCVCVADLGCGDARFIEYMLKNGLYPELEQLNGMDVSPNSLDRGCKRTDRFIQEIARKAAENMENKQVGDKQENENKNNQSQQQSTTEKCDVEQSEAELEQEIYPGVELFRGSVTNPCLVSNDAWPRNFDGTNGVALIEVIEHIYPTYTALIAPVILGGLQPEVLVVTTPNWEYNEILRFLGGAGRGPRGRDGHPLRDQDHKFEWDRKQFSRWAQRAADQFGYDVEISMIGNCVEEDLALESSQCRVNKSVGGATQAAVFTFNGNWPPPVPQISLLYSTLTGKQAEADQEAEEWQEEEEEEIGQGNSDEKMETA